MCVSAVYESHIFIYMNVACVCRGRHGGGHLMEQVRKKSIIWGDLSVGLLERVASWRGLSLLCEPLLHSLMGRLY